METKSWSLTPEISYKELYISLISNNETYIHFFPLRILKNVSGKVATGLQTQIFVIYLYI